MKLLFSLFIISLMVVVSNVQSQDFTNNGLTFERDIKPIFTNRCASCHNGNNSLPDILDKETAIENRYEIKNKLFTRQMPYFGKMTESERETIIQWVNQGE